VYEVCEILYLGTALVFVFIKNAHKSVMKKSMNAKNWRHPFFHYINFDLKQKRKGITGCGNFSQFSNFAIFLLAQKPRNFG